MTDPHIGVGGEKKIKFGGGKKGKENLKQQMKYRNGRTKPDL